MIVTHTHTHIHIYSAHCLPLTVTTEYGAEFPVVRGRSLLVIYFIYIYSMYMLIPIF